MISRMRERTGAIAMSLTDDEWEVLAQGLGQWGGAATLTDEWALALGFASRRHFEDQVTRLEEALNGREALTAQDWLRVIQATELVFINDVVGAGVEWSLVTRFTDENTVGLLRSIQEKWMSATYPD